MATTPVIVIIIMVGRVCCTPHILTNVAIIIVVVVGRRCTPHILTKVGMEVGMCSRMHTPHIVMNMMGGRMVWMDCAPHMM